MAHSGTGSILLLLASGCFRRLITLPSVGERREDIVTARGRREGTVRGCREGTVMTNKRCSSGTTASQCVQSRSNEGDGHSLVTFMPPPSPATRFRILSSARLLPVHFCAFLWIGQGLVGAGLGARPRR